MLDPQRVAAVRVLVVGDVMLDRYWFGKVERISPEAPVPIISIEHVEARAGGAANVAMNIVSLGARCTLGGVVGDDEAGEELTSLLKSTPIRLTLTIETGGRTVTKLRMVSQNQQLMRADFDGTPGDEALAAYINAYESALDNTDVVVMSDYGKGGLGHVEKMIEAANKLSKPVLVDPKGDDFKRYANATIITPNLREFEAVTGRVRDDEDLKNKAIELIKQLNVHGILITRSEKGMVLVEREEQWFDYPSMAKEVYDVSGAGDTVVAVLGLGYALGLPYEAVVRMANTAAGIVVGKLGTATASFDEINQAIDQGPSRRIP